MPEIVIGLFPESREAEEVVPMLANRGYHSDDIDVIGGRGAMVSGDGSDLLERLARLGVADEKQTQSFVDAVSHGGTVIATRTTGPRKAEQMDELMRDHGATQCVRAPDSGWQKPA